MKQGELLKLYNSIGKDHKWTNHSDYVVSLDRTKTIYLSSDVCGQTFYIARGMLWQKIVYAIISRNMFLRTAYNLDDVRKMTFCTLTDGFLLDMWAHHTLSPGIIRPTPMSGTMIHGRL